MADPKPVPELHLTCLAHDDCVHKLQDDMQELAWAYMLKHSEHGKDGLVVNSNDMHEVIKAASVTLGVWIESALQVGAPHDAVMNTVREIIYKSRAAIRESGTVSPIKSDPKTLN